MIDKFTLLRSSDVFSHLTNLKYIPRWVILSFDIFLCLVSYYISFYINLRIYTNLLDVRILSPIQGLGVVTVFQIFFFWIFHTYSGVLRYSSYVDATKLLLAVFFNIGILSLTRSEERRV